MGRPSGRSLSFRPVVCSMEQRTHKCSGTPSSLVGSEVLLSGNFGLPGVAVDRQHNRGGLSEQRRGEGWGGVQVSNLGFLGNQAANMVCEVTSVSDSQFVPGKLNVLADSLSRKGQIIHTEWTQHRGHSVSDFSLLGSPTHRFVCHETK